MLYHLELLSTGGWFFWLIIIGMSILVNELVDNDRFIASALALSGTLSLFVGFGDLQPIQWLTQNWYNAIMMVLAYVAIGIVWACFFKWIIWLKTTSMKINELKAEWIKIGLTAIDMKTRLEYRGLPTSAPLVMENKKRIFGWAICWPGSMISTLGRDPFKFVVELAISMFSGAMQKMSNAIFKDIKF